MKSSNNLLLLLIIQILFSCTKNESSTYAKDTFYQSNKSVIIDTLKRSDIKIERNRINGNREVYNILINASAWLRKAFNHWHNNQQLDSIELIILKNAKYSGYFSSRMIDTIELRIKQPGNLKFHRYFYNAGKLSETFGSFSTKDSIEITKNLFFDKDLAIYTTLFSNVLNDVPVHEEGYEWLFDIGKNKERWLFSVQLVKEDGEWKIDLIDKKYTVYKQ
jgi:hypothetical protein